MTNLTVSQDFDAFVFDMDGTLLDTLPDLVGVTNETMKHFGHPEHTQDEILLMVGKGARYLMEQALPEGQTDAYIDEVLKYWQHIYPEYGHKFTQPYPGIVKTLEALKAAGKKTAVLSNKYDEGVKDLASRYFPGLFDLVLGEGPVPRKPDPAGLKYILQELGCSADRCAYFGDSAGDMQAAHGAGAFACGVTWGYQTRDALIGEDADVLLDSTNAIPSVTRG